VREIDKRTRGEHRNADELRASASRALLTHPARLAGIRAGRHNAGPRAENLREWHAMSVAERAERWNNLVSFTIWLESRYDLAADGRLPNCWHAHPGIIEEIWALMIWRHNLYQDTADPASAAAMAGSASSWHQQLVAFTHRVRDFHAPACRARHQDAPDHARPDPAKHREWKAADPAIGIPAAQLARVSDLEAARTMSREVMTALLEAGHAKRPIAELPEFARIGEHWWTLGPTSWVRVDEPGLVERINLFHARSGPTPDSSDPAGKVHDTQTLDTAPRFGALR